MLLTDVYQKDSQIGQQTPALVKEDVFEAYSLPINIFIKELIEEDFPEWMECAISIMEQKEIRIC